MKKRLCHWLAIIFSILFLICGTALAESNVSGQESTSSTPVNEAKNCTYTASEASRYAQLWVGDDDVETYHKVSAGGFIAVSWDETVPVDFVFYQWEVCPQCFTIETLDANGNVISSAEGSSFLDDGIAVDETVRGVRLASEYEMRLGSLIPYSGGAPESYHAWQPTVEKADFLVIAMHPDDDCIFMGALMPIYGAEQHYTGTIMYMSASRRMRNTEALNGAWTMGLRSYPIFAGLNDVRSTKVNGATALFNEEIVIKSLVRYFRQIKPEVVMTHDTRGEYGHWQHKILSAAAQKAVILAADATYDPDSAEQYGTWQVKKLYLHLYKENTIQLDALSPLDAFDGLNAWEVAQKAYDCHVSQSHSHHPCDNQGVASLGDYGLAFTTVGYDTGINDMFENIPKGDLVRCKEWKAQPPKS